jgi:chaperone modulatory protein CbpM
MAKKIEMTEIIIDNTSTTISFVEVCQQYGVSEEVLFELLEYGLIEDIASPNKNLAFEPAHLQRILSACRLQTDLHINSHGAILALELMDELTELRRELEILRRHLHGTSS